MGIDGVKIEWVKSVGGWEILVYLLKSHTNYKDNSCSEILMVIYEMKFKKKFTLIIKSLKSYIKIFFKNFF